MRRTVARRLRAQAREIHSRPGRSQREEHVALQVQRGASNLARRRWARHRVVQAHMSSGHSRAVAESMVPPVPLTARIVYCRGPRATYKFLKQLHKEQRRSPR